MSFCTVLGIIHIESCVVVYLLVGFGARSVLGTRPRAARTVSRLSGTAMILIALALVGEQVIHTTQQLT